MKSEKKVDPIVLRCASCAWMGQRERHGGDGTFTFCRLRGPVVEPSSGHTRAVWPLVHADKDTCGDHSKFLKPEAPRASAGGGQPPSRVKRTVKPAIWVNDTLMVLDTDAERLSYGRIVTDLKRKASRNCSPCGGTGTARMWIEYASQRETPMPDIFGVLEDEQGKRLLYPCDCTKKS